MFSLDSGVSATLMKVVLPICLTAACLFRYNGLSLVYLLCLLCIPLLQSPTAQSMKGATGKYMKLVVAISASACIGQLIFQIVLLIDKPYGEFLEECGHTEKILRQIGFQRLDIGTLSAIRLLVPDILVFLVSAVVLASCLKLLVRENSEQQTESTTHIDATYQRKTKKSSIVIAGVRSLFTMILLAFAAVIVPSMISAVYFVSFLIVVTWWSFYKSMGRHFIYWQMCWMVFSSLHLVLLYLYQFQFFQDNLDPNDLPARLVGLVAVIKTDCSDPYKLVLHDGLLWPMYVNPGALLFLYWYCAVEIRRWLEGPELIEVPSRPRRNKRNTGERESSSSKKKLLVDEEKRSSSPQYNTMEGADPQPEGIIETADDRRDSAVMEQPKASPLGTFVAYITKQSYIAALVLMMVWSITYHSWLTFVLLLWACACWIIPGSRKCALYSSPLLVFYAETLIIIQFIYGLNLTEDELPTVTKKKKVPTATLR